MNEASGKSSIAISQGINAAGTHRSNDVTADTLRAVLPGCMLTRFEPSAPAWDTYWENQLSLPTVPVDGPTGWLYSSSG